MVNDFDYRSAMGQLKAGAPEGSRSRTTGGEKRAKQNASGEINVKAHKLVLCGFDDSLRQTVLKWKER
jgi:hypothetical protein